MNINSKKKQIYGNIKIILYFIKLSHKISKGFLPTLTITYFFKALYPFINIIIPKFIIAELIGNKDLSKLTFLVLALILFDFVLYFIIGYMEEKVFIKNEKFMNDIELDLGQYLMNLEYSFIEDSEILDLQHKALYPVLKQGILKKMFEEVFSIISCIITLCGVFTILVSLNPYIAIILLSISLINFILYKNLQKISYELNQKLIPLNRKFTYYIRTITDYTMGKDIRLYEMNSLINNKVENYNKESYKILLRLSYKNGFYKVLQILLVILQIIITYVYMIILVLNKLLSIADFSMYVNSARQFSTSFNSIMQNLVDLNQNCNYLNEYVKLKSIGVFEKKVDQIKLDNEINVIEFKDVSFKYPKSEKNVLENINLTINKGDKIAIVGLNGTGKTTFIKLLVKLYKPTKGEILINGINLDQISYSSYMQKLSVLFQDFKLFSLTVKENLVLQDNIKIDDNEIIKILKLMGLENRILNSKKQLNSYLFKNFENDGVELSGGESQKMAIARLIYRNTPIVILDEPTSALDPISEMNIYKHLDELINNNNRNKIAIYISHRLSSCKFCDRIVVFDHGTITETGTHIKLLNNNGLYNKMWNSQAKYYKN